MSNKTKNIIIALECIAIAVLSCTILYQLFPETMREIGRGVVLVLAIVALPGSALACDDMPPRDPDTY